MPVLHLILAEAALELVPEALWSHPAVSKSAKTRGKKPGRVLLDDTYHHSAMKVLAREGRFDDLERRGRPDIVHTTLLVALESRLNKAGGLRVWVHTRDDRLIGINPEVRLQRAQHRFFGLLEQLLETGSVPSGAPPEKALMWVEEDVTLKTAIMRTGARRPLVLDEDGDDVDLGAVLTESAAGGGPVCAVIGAFPTGRLLGDLEGLDLHRVALGRTPLTAWTVAGEAVVRFPSGA